MTTNEPYIEKRIVDVNGNNETVRVKDDIINNIEKESDNESESESDNERTNGQNNNDEAKTFWINDPIILFDKNAITQVWPLENMTREQKINAITRLVILLTLTGFLFLNDIKILITGITSIIILVFTYYILNRNNNLNKIKESFSNEEIYDKVKHNFSNPTSINPIMNVLLPEIQDNPNKLPAAPSYNNAVKKIINEETKSFIVSNFDNNETVKKNLFDDKGDNVVFEQSMRQFYTTANTRGPNNQAEFARFCYGNMASCKDGDVEMCFKTNV
jgi:hypothetical protein